MKKIIAYILTAAAVVAFALAILTASAEAVEDVPDWAARQDACHQAAELLRELGPGMTTRRYWHCKKSGGGVRRGGSPAIRRLTLWRWQRPFTARRGRYRR